MLRRPPKSPNKIDLTPNNISRETTHREFTITAREIYSVTDKKPSLKPDFNLRFNNDRETFKTLTGLKGIKKTE